MALPPILARDYVAHRIKIAVGLFAYAATGAALGLIALVTMGMIR